jgi:oxidase EvaA
VPVHALHGWALSERTLTSPSSGTSLVCVAVTATDREVAAWCQPLLQTDETTCELWCAPDADGVLRFAFRYAAEPGLIERVELGPTMQSDSDDAAPQAQRDAQVRLEVRQSDEGGRFFTSVCRYVIVEVPEMADAQDHVWLSLADVAALSARPMTFTNEARSAISLLLSLA